MRRILPAIGLFLLSPLVAEYLLGDLPVTALFALVVLAPMYGGAALLIREVCRRFGWGWPSMLILALAYSILEETIVTQSLFDPDWGGRHLHLLDRGYVPALGIALPYTLFVLSLHVVWSISVPIVLVESIVHERRGTPWLGRIGLAVVAVVCAAGVSVNFFQSRPQGGFTASTAQLTVSALVLVALTGLAVFLGRRAGRRRADGEPSRSVAGRSAAGSSAAGRVPAPLLLGTESLILTSAFVIAWYGGRPSIQPWVFAGAVLVAWLAAVLLVARWSARTGWTRGHQLALAGGALLTYAWHGFQTRPFVPATHAVQLLSHIVLALGALLVLAVAAVRLRAGESHPPRPTESRESTESAPTSATAHPAR
ncbi:hypothetical protein HCC61_19930 [Streptomyces sp. HNM0575]|uniref:hypothetical protein n=1 Tax=Streptomyces sp. HNM0575 TaxID=2716338 RepID=UPI00145CDAE7|nr:hypothetical protein [Streptomyces sp. HNM0575]NLU74918.1 hypothetical protein [Streptomyces sp. HNM0575]